MTIVTRAEWGAVSEQARPAMRLPAVAVWLHHSVTTPTWDPHADMRTIQQIGISRFGYLSYSYAVSPNGTILEGQGTRVGAHTANQNSTSFGVVLIGNYQNLRVTDAQVDAVRWLVAHLIERKALKAGVYPTDGHRNAPGAATACPGNWAMQRLPEMRVPWAPLPAPLPPPAGPTYDYEENTTKTTMVHIGPLDSNGNGWADWQPGLGRDPIIVGVVQLGPSPPDDGGYWLNQARVNLSAQPRGGSVRVVVRNGTPGDTVTAWVTVA